MSWQTVLFLALILGAGLLYRRKKMGGDLIFFAIGALLIVLGLLKQKEVIHCFANETVLSLFFLYLIGQILFASGFFHGLQKKVLPSETPSRIQIALFSLLTSFFDQRQILPLLFSKLRHLGKVSWQAASYLALIGSGMTLLGSISALFLVGYTHQSCQMMVLPFFFPALISLPLFFLAFFLSALLSRKDAADLPQGDGSAAAIIWPNSPLVGRMASKQLLLQVRSIFRKGESLPTQTLLQTGDYLAVEEALLSPEQRKAVCLITPSLPAHPASEKKRFYYGIVCLAMVVGLSVGVPYVLATLVAFTLILLTRQVPFLEAFKGIAWERILLAISAYMISYGVKNSGLGLLLFPWVEPFSQGFALFTLICFAGVTLLSFLFPPIITIALLFPIAEQIVQGTPCPLFPEHKFLALPFILAGAFPFFSRISSDTLSITLPFLRKRRIERLFPLILWGLTAIFLYGIASYKLSFLWT